METYTRSERAQYNIDRDRKCVRLGITKNQYNWLRRQAEKLSRLDEAYCNGEVEKIAIRGVSIEPDRLYEMAERKIIDSISTKFFGRGFHLYHQSDPRGCALYLSDEPMDQSNYTNGVAIY